MSESSEDVQALYDASPTAQARIEAALAQPIVEMERRLHANRPDLVESMKESAAHPELRVTRPERPVRD